METETKVFQAAGEAEKVVAWIRDWFSANGPTATAVIGMSGGKDSTVCAALLAKALGRERVFGIIMPNGEMTDLDDARAAVEFLGIRSAVVNIQAAYQGILSGLFAALSPLGGQDEGKPDGRHPSATDMDNRLMGQDMGKPDSRHPYGVFSEGAAQESSLAGKADEGRMADFLATEARINIPPRLRMTVLYAIAQNLPEGGRVANTCNASEDYVGYSTKFGDAAGDFSPLSEFTVTEVLAIGDYLGLPGFLVHKTPSDGLSGMSDEEKLGFTYAALDRYIRSGVCEDETVRKKIDQKHRANLHKLLPMPKYERSIEPRA